MAGGRDLRLGRQFGGLELEEALEEFPSGGLEAWGGNALEALPGLIGAVESDKAACGVKMEGVALERIEGEGVLEGEPVIEGGVPVLFEQVVEGFSVAELEGKLVRCESGGGAEGGEHFCFQFWACVDTFLDKSFPEGEEQLAKTEMVGRGLRFQLDSIQHEGEGAGMVGLLGIVGGQLLMNDRDLWVDTGCGEELIASPFAVPVAGEQLAVEEARFEAVRIVGEQVAVGGGDSMELALNVSRFRCFGGRRGVQFLFPLEHFEEPVLEEGARADFRRRGGRRGRGGAGGAGGEAGKEEEGEEPEAVPAGHAQPD